MDSMIERGVIDRQDKEREDFNYMGMIERVAKEMGGMDLKTGKIDGGQCI